MPDHRIRPNKDGCEEFLIVNQDEVDRLMHRHDLDLSEIRAIAIEMGWIVRQETVH